MSKDAAHTSRWRTADVVFGSSLVLGFILEYLWPLSLVGLLEPFMLHVIGAPVLVLGGLIVIFSKKELLRFRQPSEPSAPTTMIVKSGLYKYSRNPLYLGLALSFSGLAFATDMPWWLVLLAPTMVITQTLLIRPEERYLEKKFGKEFLDYKAAVGRWF